jgi:Na+/H+ antiporter NhaD/arsenite permease-like protein
VKALTVTAVAFVVASSVQAPLAFVALGGAAVLLAGALYHRRLEWSRLGREISWSLFVFISGMFLVVRAVENLGLTGRFDAGLVALRWDRGRSPEPHRCGGPSLGGPQRVAIARSSKSRLSHSLGSAHPCP